MSSGQLSSSIADIEQADIDRALSKIDEVASTREGIAVEEGLILRGCCCVFNQILPADIIPVLSLASWIFTWIPSND